MRKYAQRKQTTTETAQPKTSEQAPAKEILQAYKKKIVQMQNSIEDDELLQGKFDASTTETAQLQEAPNHTGLPDNLKSGIENLSGYSMDNVQVHYNSPKPAQLQALAYTQGTDIHVAPGQEQHLPHEAWHVVQQMQGRVQPTTQLQGINVNDNEGLEKEADVMGDIALSVKENGFNRTDIINATQVDINNEVIQGHFYVKERDGYIWNGESVNENLYIKTEEEKVYDEKCEESIDSNLCHRDVRYTYANDKDKPKYPVYIERVLDLTDSSTRASNEAAKTEKTSGNIGASGSEYASKNFKTTSSIYKLLNERQSFFNVYLSNINSSFTIDSNC